MSRRMLCTYTCIHSIAVEPVTEIAKSEGEPLATDEAVKGSWRSLWHLDGLVCVARGRDDYHVVRFC